MSCSRAPRVFAGRRLSRAFAFLLSGISFLWRRCCCPVPLFHSERDRRDGAGQRSRRICDACRVTVHNAVSRGLGRIAIGTSSHSSMLSSAFHLRWTGVYGVGTAACYLHRCSALTQWGRYMVMGRFGRIWESVGTALGTGWRWGAQHLLRTWADLTRRAAKCQLLLLNTFADVHVILSFCHSFILHVMGGRGARQTGRRAEKSNGGHPVHIVKKAQLMSGPAEWPC